MEDCRLFFVAAFLVLSTSDACVDDLYSASRNFSKRNLGRPIRKRCKAVPLQKKNVESCGSSSHVLQYVHPRLFLDYSYSLVTSWRQAMPKIGVAMPTISRPGRNGIGNLMMQFIKQWCSTLDERVGWVPIHNQVSDYIDYQVSLGGCVCLFLCMKLIHTIWIHLACISQRLKPTRPIAEKFCCKSLEHSSYRERECDAMAEAIAKGAICPMPSKDARTSAKSSRTWALPSKDHLVSLFHNHIIIIYTSYIFIWFCFLTTIALRRWFMANCTGFNWSVP